MKTCTDISEYSRLTFHILDIECTIAHVKVLFASTFYVLNSKKSIYTTKYKFCFLPTCEFLVTTIFHSSLHKYVYQQQTP